MKYLLTYFFVFLLSPVQRFAYANDFQDICREVEERMYTQTLDNPLLYKWVESLHRSLEEQIQNTSHVQTPLIEKAMEEYLYFYNRFQTIPHTYHYIVTTDSKMTHFSWVLTDLYSSYVRVISVLRGFSRDEEFERNGIKTGQLPFCAIRPFIESLKTTSYKRFVSEDAFPERYFVPPGYGGHEDIINTGLHGYVLGPKQLETLKPIISELTPALTACMGSPWKIINVLCWETTPEAPKWGMNNWHTDGKPIHIRKVMVYLSGASSISGSTEFILPDGTHKIIEGPPGVWALAKVSELTHRGLPPKMGKRLVVELRLEPALELDPRPFSAGFHSFFPLIPWFNPFASNEK